MQMRSIVSFYSLWSLCQRLDGLPFLVSLSLSSVLPIVVHSLSSAMISTLTPITDSVRLHNSIGARLSVGHVSMETKNNADPRHCCSLPANSALNKDSGEACVPQQALEQYGPLQLIAALQR